MISRWEGWLLAIYHERVRPLTQVRIDEDHWCSEPSTCSMSAATLSKESPGLRFPRSRAVILKAWPTAQRLVNDLAEGSAGAARFRLKLSCHIVIQGQCRSHAVMLLPRHPDVNEPMSMSQEDGDDREVNVKE